MSTKGPTLYMWRLNDAYTQNNQTLEKLKATYTSLSAQLKYDYDSCKNGLANTKNWANTGLANAFNVANKVEAQKCKIESIFADLSKILKKVQDLKTSIQKLVQQLKKLFY